MKKSITPMTTVGLDVSEKYLQVLEMTPEGEITEEGRFRNTAARLRSRYEGKEPKRFVLEAGSHTRWITLLLRELGHEVLVVNPRCVPMISGTLYKTDKIDAQILAMLGSEVPHLLPTIRLRSQKHQKALTLVRSRATAVDTRTKLTNAIRGMLKPYGVRISSKGATLAFIKEVEELARAAGLSAMIEPLLPVLRSLRDAIKSYDEEMEALLPQVAPDAMHLLEIPGVSTVTVLYFVASVGDPHLFPKSRDVASYFGLCPRRADSGDYVSQLRITKAGDSYMRMLLSNCSAHILGQWGKDSDLRRWGLKREGGGSKVEKRKAKVAVARKLAVLLLTLWKSGNRYDRFYNSKRAGAGAGAGAAAA